MALKQQLMWILGRVHGINIPLCVQRILSFICGVQSYPQDKILTVYDNDRKEWMIGQDVVDKLYMETIKNTHKMMIDACKHGCINIVQYLCIYVDPGAERNNALKCASRNGHLSVVQYLCEHPKVDPVDCLCDTMICASEQGHLHIIKYLCGCTRVLLDDDTCLLATRVATENGHTEIAEYLDSY